jgi:UDP-glucose:(heptosyl)LPS alpha-1,3-glucosyltransferase
MAEACARRGHEVSVLTIHWEGPTPPALEVTPLPVRAWTNHGQCQEFARLALARCATGGYAVVVGFNKMPGLDWYFAGDPCYVTRARGRSWLYRVAPRYRTYAALEGAVFEPASRTRIMVLSEGQRQEYMDCWGTPVERFEVLPPGISRDRRLPPNASAIRQAFRAEWGVGEHETVVLMVGSDFKRKGLDRALRAVAALPEAHRGQTRLFVVGRGQTGPFTRLAGRLGLQDRLNLVGGRDDVTRFLLGADLLLHPAYTETYGMVLIEAMACGLPVLVTGSCGYASHVGRAEAGLVVPMPFVQTTLDQLLERMLEERADGRWRTNGLNYIAQTDVFSLPERGVDLIESTRKSERAHDA